jgi:subtilisin family serine protease
MDRFFEAVPRPHRHETTTVLTRLLFMLTLILLAVAPALAQHRYFYFKEARPLKLDTTRVAVRLHKAVKPQALTKTLGQRGMPNTQMSAWPAAGWSLITLPAQQRPIQPLQAVATVVNTGQTEYVSPVFVGQDGGPLLVTPDILVRFVPTVAPEQATQLLAGLGEIRERNFGGMSGAFRVHHTGRNGFETLEAANRLAQRPEVLWAEPDMIFTGRGDFIPNDTFFSSCWGLHNTGQTGGTADQDMDAPEAWDYTTGSSSIVVVVIDTGVQQDHPDINQRAGLDFTTDGGNGGPVNTFDNHGTAVAGCVSAKINNALGVVGIAPDCLSASARAFISTNAQGSWTSQASWTVNALNWAQTIGARVTNNSNIYGFQSSSIADRYTQTRDAGIVHFACAGNNGSGTLSYPSSLPSVNAVAALNHFGNRASFSQFGVGLDFSAPGASIATTDRTGSVGYVSGDYVSVNGTSFASPYTAGVAALLLSLDSQLTAILVEQIMQATCVDKGAAGYDTDFGWGFVNAFQAVRRIAIFVDKNNNGAEDGSAARPFNTLAEAISAAQSGFMVNIYVRANDYAENPVTNKTIRIRNWTDTGTVRVGTP